MFAYWAASHISCAPKGVGSTFRHAGSWREWQECMVEDSRSGLNDVVGLLLDCEAGRLTVYRNGVRLGMLIQNEVSLPRLYICCTDAISLRLWRR